MDYRKGLFIIIAIACIMRAGYLVQLQENPLPERVIHHSSFDQERFFSLAQIFYTGNLLGTIEMAVSPAYSYVVALLFRLFRPSINAVFVFQALLGVLAVYALYASSVILFGDKKAGLLAALIGALYGPLIFHEGCLERDVLIG